MRPAGEARIEPIRQWSGRSFRSFSCAVTVPSGTWLPVAATDPEGNTRTATATVTTTDAMTEPPTSLQVTPQAMVRNSVRTGIDRVWGNVLEGVRVTSVYRSPNGNARHSTAVSSGHIWGVAADFKYAGSPSGKMPRPQFDALRAIVLDPAQGAAVYSEEYELHGTHVHGGFECWPGRAEFEGFMSQ